jgi:flavodoxin
MRVLVVFESLYGSTAAVGEAIAASLRSEGVTAEAMPVDHVDPASAEGLDLLVVGGPTHMHGLSRASTRKAGAKDEKNAYTEPTIAPGLREWFEGIPDGEGRMAAAFDTRFDQAAWLTGSAAKVIAKRLGARGFRLAADPESFFVTKENALADGEVAHATRWGAILAAALPARTTG